MPDNPWRCFQEKKRLKRWRKVSKQLYNFDPEAKALEIVFKNTQKIFFFLKK